ncbi:hypothetical protein CYMTET_31328 [Cymbomonas tetramitiformis]|uniref:Uncharacterized protein n=1 Tax=Cymbomonas tetramitiformis TaxID=36881 RepID=A0AAE0FI44_9CHLO|nr:hypothetical protein CYMTET_31328 [Cymbomonas tetramitiformis]
MKPGEKDVAVDGFTLKGARSARIAHLDFTACAGVDKIPLHRKPRRGNVAGWDLCIISHALEPPTNGALSPRGLREPPIRGSI